MFTKSLLLGAGLAALAVAEPIPQAAPTSSYNPAALSSELASLSALDAFTSIYSDLPTLPSSVESVLATAFPTSLATETDIACQIETAAPAWYNSLPADVKSALTSYESALLSWSKEHSAALASLTSGYTAPTGGIGVCSNTGAAVVGATASTTGTTAKNTGTAAGATATGTGAGTATSSGSAAGASGSKAAAPRATGAVAASFAGFFGVLGLMAAL